MKTIAVTRTDNIGDVVTTLPVCGIIKQHFPDSKLIFLGRNYTKDIINRCSDVDGFIDAQALKDNPSTAADILKKANIDIIIFIFPDKRLARIAKRAGIPCRIGTSHRLYNLIYCNKFVGFSRKKTSLNEAQLNVFLLKALNCYKDYSMQELTDLVHIKNSGFDTGKNINLLSSGSLNLIIHPKSHGHGREWPVHYYRELVDYLDKRIKIFVCGTQKESVGVNIEGGNVINLFGTMTLEEYINFIQHSDVLLASGTGPLHIAGIMNINAVGLFPPLHGIDPQRWHPLGKKVKVFCHDKAGCVDCKKKGNCTCMEMIHPKDVAAYINNLAKEKLGE